MTTRNVRARLLVTRGAPGTPDLLAPLTIRWLGDRFHVTDESGRSCTNVVADVASPRGFGTVPRTMEEFMDARFPAALPPGRTATDLYGDAGEDIGLVDEPWEGMWEIPAERITPVAEQLFAPDLDGLKPTGEARLLGRDCLEYRTFLEGVEDGRPFRSEVRRLVSGPYVLLREVTDTGGSSLRLCAEVTELSEGTVAEEDVLPPA